MPALPPLYSFALLVGLSFFFGLAFEEFYSASEHRPGGIRTFPLLALAGGMLYLLDTAHLSGFIAGLLVVGAWLFLFYRERLRGLPEAEDGADTKLTLVVPLCNLHAYLLGAVALALPPWVAVALTVASVLLLTGRERLHALARQVHEREIVVAGQFLILTGIVLPLLPNEPVTTLTTITPRQAWLALLAVCTISYASYLVQRIIAPAEGDLWMAVLGGAYSSTATTVALARRARAEPEHAGNAFAGITLATAVMYLRILLVVAVFNMVLARELAPALLALAALGAIIALWQYWRGRGRSAIVATPFEQRNPLELTTAAIFAAAFVAISLLSTWVGAEFGRAGIYVLAAIVGVTDIDPFVLNLAQGGAATLSIGALAGAILIAASSNNLLKAGYTVAFSARRGSASTVAALLVLAALGAAVGFLLGGT